MKMKKWAIWLVACVFMAPFMACSEGTPQAEIRHIDGLNEQAYAHLYRDAKVAQMWADSALIVADKYAIGRAEAHYLLGEVALIGQAYAEAHNHYEQAMACTDDDLETLLANVGKMRIYQRTSQNKEFYECRLKAVRLLNKLSSEVDEGWSEHRRHRFFVDIGGLLCLLATTRQGTGQCRKSAARRSATSGYQPIVAIQLPEGANWVVRRAIGRRATLVPIRCVVLCLVARYTQGV